MQQVKLSNLIGQHDISILISLKKQKITDLLVSKDVSYSNTGCYDYMIRYMYQL